MGHDKRITFSGLTAVAALLAAAGGLALPSPALACGGLFCNAVNPVNQSAERILFVDNGDGTTTAVIQIMYEGPGDKFAWVLPLGNIPNPDEDIRVSSDLALQRLQNATNPIYTLNVITEGTCKDDFGGGGFRNSASGSEAAFDSDGAADANADRVIVEASGSVGPFDFELISVIDSADDKAQVAVDWLEDNGYELGIGADVLRPYLEAGQKLLCVRLTKGNDAGSVRPLMITYEGDKPSIPIRPTAVAAQDDMGILVFVGGQDRAIPTNYALLELNDARIDWFNPSQTYNDVVILAAGEASGHGFVTEYADTSDTLDQVIVRDFEREQWSNFQGNNYSSDQQMVQASFAWSSWDGYRDAFAAATTLPAGISLDDIINCTSCYLDDAKLSTGVEFSRDRFRTALYEQVVRPMFDTDALLASTRYITRLYTTMSAEDMTEDPSFDFNADLEDVSNVHTADQIIMCTPEYTFFEAPYRIELPSGAVVYGVERGVWPVDLEDSTQPGARRISMAGPVGEPTEMINNVQIIDEALAEGAPEGVGPKATPGDDTSVSSAKGDGGLCSVGAVGNLRGSDHNTLPALLLLGAALGFLRRRRA